MAISEAQTVSRKQKMRKIKKYCFKRSMGLKPRLRRPRERSLNGFRDFLLLVSFLPFFLLGSVYTARAVAVGITALLTQSYAIGNSVLYP